MPPRSHDVVRCFLDPCRLCSHTIAVTALIVTTTTTVFPIQERIEELEAQAEELDALDEAPDVSASDMM